jgi:hypothetical protein
MLSCDFQALSAVLYGSVLAPIRCFVLLLRLRDNAAHEVPMLPSPSFFDGPQMP